MEVKAVHERIRSLIEPEEEVHEVRGKTKDCYVILRYARRGSVETEEVFVSSRGQSISLVLSRGSCTATYVKDGRIEGKVLSEEEAEKVIDEVVKMLGMQTQPQNKTE